MPINSVCVYCYIVKNDSSQSFLRCIRFLQSWPENFKSCLNRIKNLGNKIRCKLCIVASHTLACLFVKQHFIIFSKP